MHQSSAIGLLSVGIHEIQNRQFLLTFNRFSFPGSESLCSHSYDFVQMHHLPNSSALANKSLWWLQAPRETSKCIVGPGLANTPHSSITRAASGSGRSKRASRRGRTPTGHVQPTGALQSGQIQKGCPTRERGEPLKDR